MTALSSQDNLNAKTQMVESEMGAWGLASEIYTQLTSEQGPPSEMDVIAHIEGMQLNTCFTPVEWTYFIRLRRAFTADLAASFGAMQFQAAGGQARIRAQDFGTVAVMDERCPLNQLTALIGQFTETFANIKKNNQ